MMVGAVMFAVAAFSMTNALSSFSTMVERTVPCPVVSELKVGTMFDLDLPQSSDCRIEVAVGTMPTAKDVCPMMSQRSLSNGRRMRSLFIHTGMPHAVRRGGPQEVARADDNTHEND